MLGALKTGEIIDAARIRRVCLALLAVYAASLAFLAATADGMKDYQGRPLGTDFSNVYAAGRMALDGRAHEAWDWPRHYAEQQRVFADPAIPFYGWHYPPFFLIAAAGLALLPYTAAMIVWQGATAPLYLLAIRTQTKAPLTLLAALAFPAVFVNLTHGQNGFLTAGLLAGGLILLDRRPLVAGVLIGLLAYKPQFGVMIPLVLAATRRWRTFAAAGAAVVALAALSTAMFGAEIWTAFLESGSLTRRVVLEAGETGWEKIQSLFAALRALGADLWLAYGAQGALALGVAASLVALWRAPAAYELKAAGLILGALLATPYLMDYDLMAAAPALVFLALHGAREGFAPYEKSLLAGAFLAPLFARPIAEATLIPLGLLSLLALYALTLARAFPRAFAAARAGALRWAR